MNRQKLIQGEAFSIAFFNICLPVVNERKVHLTDADVVEFKIGRRNRKPVIIKRYPGQIEREVNDTFVVHLTAKETVKLPCLLYQMQLTIDMRGHGEDVYTLVDKELEVVAK